MWKRFWRPEVGIFLAVWLLLLVGGRSRLFRDPDTFWHTVVGDRILNAGFFDQDPYSFTFAGERWIPHQWLGEVLMALIHRVDQLNTLLLVTATLLAGLYAWAAGRLIRAGMHWSLAVLVLALTLAPSATHFHVRPHLASIVLLGITAGWLGDLEAGRKSIRHLFWLVPLYLLWTQLHGGMLGGLCSIGLVMAGWTCYRLAGLESPVKSVRAFLLLALLILLCAATIPITPYGLGIFQVWTGIMDSPILPQIIEEHAPPSLTRPDGLFLYGYGLFYLIMLAGTYPKPPRVTWLLPLAWLYLASTRIRHAPLFAVTAVVALADLFPNTRWAAMLAKSGSDFFQYPPPLHPSPLEGEGRWDWRPLTLPVAVVLIALVLQIARVPLPGVGREWARLDPQLWPTDLQDELKKVEDDGTPIFNEYNLGGFLIYHHPGFRVFVDSRCELYGPEWLRDFVQADQEDTAGYFARWQEQYRAFDFALVRPGSGFEDYFKKQGWAEIGRGEGAILYRKAPASGGR